MRRIKLMLEWERSAFDMVKLVILQQIKTAKTHLCPSFFIFFPFMSSSLCPGVFAAALTHRCHCCQWPSSAVILRRFFPFLFWLKRVLDKVSWAVWQSLGASVLPPPPIKDKMIQHVPFFFLCSAELAHSNSAYPWTLIYMFLSLCR